MGFAARDRRSRSGIGFLAPALKPHVLDLVARQREKKLEPALIKRRFFRARLFVRAGDTSRMRLPLDTPSIDRRWS